jgi:hypothetical protein
LGMLVVGPRNKQISICPFMETRGKLGYLAKVEVKGLFWGYGKGL